MPATRHRSTDQIGTEKRNPFFQFPRRGVRGDNRMTCPVVTRMLTIADAAERLGYTVKGLRNIVDRSRARAQGRTVRGPVIKFMQVSRKSPILFREEWIEEFIDACTVDPHAARIEPPGRKSGPKAPPLSIESSSGLDAQFFNV